MKNIKVEIKKNNDKKIKKYARKDIYPFVVILCCGMFIIGYFLKIFSIIIGHKFTKRKYDTIIKSYKKLEEVDEL